MSVSTSLGDRSYWTAACRLFRAAGGSGQPGAYLIDDNNAKAVRIGLRSRHILCVDDAIVSTIKGGVRAYAALASDEPPFSALGALVDAEAPCFFLVSPDIKRDFIDDTLPAIWVSQPDLECTFSPAFPQGEVSFARDAECVRAGLELLARAAAADLPIEVPFRPPMPFDAVAGGWRPAESDANFLNRLDHAIGLLAEHPAGKTTLTRGYECHAPQSLDPLDLYELHASQNGDYASSHLACVEPGVVSLGCSPENKFEVRGDRLIVDIVASTCKATDDEVYIAAELLENPKQIKEHRLSIESRPRRFAPFCVDGSMQVRSEMRLKRLRNVLHLHSVAEGRLLPGTSFFTLLDSIPFPVLGSNPRELNAQVDTEALPHRYFGGLVGHTHSGSGGCFLNIRNALIKHDVIHAKVGVGLVAESNARSELQETRDKISGVMEAIHLWKARGAG